MTQPFLGQIQAFSFNWVPKGWAQCDGQLLSIQQNAALFSLLGTYYGGNGTSTFALPDLRGRVPVSQGTYVGTTYTIGESGGSSTVQLQIGQMPQHTHTLMGANVDASRPTQPAAGDALANAANPSPPANNFYGAASQLVALNPASVSIYGSGQPHDNMQPYLAINWCIALTGIFPSRN